MYDIDSARLKRRYEVRDGKTHFLNDLVLTDAGDGLYLHRNALISVNHRVTRYPLDATGLAVISAETLEVAHPALGQPTTGVITGDDFYLVANSHLQLFAALMRGDESLRAGLREATVLRIPLR